MNPEVVVCVKKWKCPICEEIHDRDINAAKNILSKYVTSLGIVGGELAENTNACGAPRSAMKQESSNTLDSEESIRLGSCKDL